ncbi:hypothetical protein K6V98_04205 [Collinsella sp. AGMB00827]|uniref:PH domain-containing protein n=1 Tax=Collinsella ureilytica TaxID=2869515 RepID=A0ABS7MJW6_9ACTN|nr:hypothetical protein [Collinsella urealyticum]MBY4797557.1 hypothetical protein [Collinsella urealyticum]
MSDDTQARDGLGGSVKSRDGLGDDTKTCDVERPAEWERQSDVGAPVELPSQASWVTDQELSDVRSTMLRLEGSGTEIEFQVNETTDQTAEVPSVPPFGRRGASLPAPPIGRWVVDAATYRSEVLIPGYASLVFPLLGAAILVMRPDFTGGAALFVHVASVVMIVAGVYTAMRTFIGHAYPREILIEPDAISLTSFGATDRFELANLTRCAVREGAAGRMHVRLAGAHARERAYFVNLSSMHRGIARGSSVDDLRTYFFALEEYLDPEGIRVRARQR